MDINLWYFGQCRGPFATILCHWRIRVWGPHGEREARVYNEGVGQSSGQEVRGRRPLKLKALLNLHNLRSRPSCPNITSLPKPNRCDNSEEWKGHLTLTVNEGLYRCRDSGGHHTPCHSDTSECPDTKNRLTLGVYRGITPCHGHRSVCGQGNISPTFWSGGDALCFVPLLFRGRHFCINARGLQLDDWNNLRKI